MKTPSIMFQGTGSGVGKSIVTAGFCRLLSDMGLRVAPFKSQNMALNSGVVNGNLEMGRAQILQAEAARVTPDVRMNPILLKPQGNSSSQLVRMGHVAGVYSAREYYTLSLENFEIVKEAYSSLAGEYDVIVIEGAGSPAEINLQATDIVNMKMAQYACSDVYIIGDIDRGGVFAWMKGTYDLVPEKSRELIKGFIINKFRGDVTLLQPGIEMFAEYVPVPVLGVLPFMYNTLEEEDSQDITSDRIYVEKPTVGVIRLPRISNFSDFAPLKANESINLIYIEKPEQIKSCDALVIPGSKSTISDMLYMREKGFEKEIKSFKGGIVGICGGFQMLGANIHDPKGIEGDITVAEGLGLLAMDTVITSEKRLEQVVYAGAGLLRGCSLKGYEMHMGRTEINGGYEQLSEAENAIIRSGNVAGTYLHGIFEDGKVTEKIFAIGGINIKADDYINEKERQLNALAGMIKENCDVDSIMKGAGL
ncbi:cobyric acid synthase [Deferribacteres bacterium DY0037]